MELLQQGNGILDYIVGGCGCLVAGIETGSYPGPYPYRV